MAPAGAAPSGGVAAVAIGPQKGMSWKDSSRYALGVAGFGGILGFGIGFPLFTAPATERGDICNLLPDLESCPQDQWGLVVLFTMVAAALFGILGLLIFRFFVRDQGAR